MIVLLPPEMEAALEQHARHLGNRPEDVVVQILQQNLPRLALPPTDAQTALRTIQSGKYARTPAPNEPIQSDHFATEKATEKAREERRWLP